MIQLPNVSISQIVLDNLKEYQNEIDSEIDFAKKAEVAKNLFGAKNVIGDVIFNEVKTALDSMCSGARRCVYCEDSLGCEVEHIRPKSLYPESCFSWENYVYACGLCNKRKSNKFTVFDGTTHELLKITKKRYNKLYKLGNVCEEAPLAQWIRASGFGPEGRRFESYRGHHSTHFVRSWLQAALR